MNYNWHGAVIVSDVVRICSSVDATQGVNTWGCYDGLVVSMELSAVWQSLHLDVCLEILFEVI